MAEKKVQQADNCVGPLACITGLINNKVHLPRDGFTAHPKDGGLPRCQKIDRARLQRVARIMHLLRKIKGIMRRDVITSRCNHRMGWRWNKLSLQQEVSLRLPSALVQRLPIHRSLLGHEKEMFLSSLDCLDAIINAYVCVTCVVFTSVFSSTGRLCARIISVLFFWQVQQRSDIGFVTTTCGASCLQRRQKRE